MLVFVSALVLKLLYIVVVVGVVGLTGGGEGWFTDGVAGTLTRHWVWVM